MPACGQACMRKSSISNEITSISISFSPDPPRTGSPRQSSINISSSSRTSWSSSSPRRRSCAAPAPWLMDFTLLRSAAPSPPPSPLPPQPSSRGGFRLRFPPLATSAALTPLAKIKSHVGASWARWENVAGSSVASCESWKSWLSNDVWVDQTKHLGDVRDIRISLGTDPESAIAKPANFSVQASSALLLLYRALLIGGIGLTFSAPAFAKTASVKQEEVAQTNVEKQEESSKSESEGSFGVSDTGTSQSFESLGDEFWNGVETPKGSVELVLKNYLATNPTNIKALDCLAYLLADKDDMGRALILFEKLEQLQPDELEWKFMKAQAHACKGDLQLAKKGFEELLKLQPFSPRALQGLVVVMDQAGERAAAFKLLETSTARAIQENKLPEARNLRMLIGQYHTLKGHLDEALQLYKELIEEDPKDFRCYLCQGIIYSALGEIDTAEQKFKHFQKLCPKDFPNRKYLDKLMSRAKREGQKVYDLKQKASASAVKGKGTETTEQSTSESDTKSLG